MECFSKSSEQERLDIFKILRFLGDINGQIILSLNVTSNKTRKALKLSKCAVIKKTYFDSLPILKRKYDDLQSVVNNKILPHCPSSFYNGLKLEQERFQVGGLTLVTFLKKNMFPCV